MLGEKVVAPHPSGKNLLLDGMVVRVEGPNNTKKKSYDVGLNGCWLWVKSKDGSGYGQYHTSGNKMCRAHRTYYAIIFGKIGIGMTIDHLCRVRSCVNPSHLEMVTGKENTLRGESFSAVNHRKDYCKNGHAFNKENTYFYKMGRFCRACNNISSSKYYHQKRRKVCA